MRRDAFLRWRRWFLLLCLLAPRADADDSAMSRLAGSFTLEGHEGEISRVIFLPGDDDRLVSAGYKDRTIRLWDLKSRRQLALVPLSFGPRDVAVSPDGKVIEYLSNTGSLRSIAVDGDTLGQPRSHWGHAGRHGRMVMSPDGRYLAIVSRDQPVTVWNRETRSLHQDYLGTTDYRAVDFAAGSRIFAAADGDVTLALWDILALEGFGAKYTYEIDRVSPGVGTWGLTFSRDGRQLATAHVDGYVTAWHLSGTRAKQIHTWRLPESAFTTVFSPGGTLLAATCQNGSVYVWNTQDGRRVQEYRGGVGSLLTIAIDADGRRMAAGSLGGDLVIWE